MRIPLFARKVWLYASAGARRWYRLGPKWPPSITYSQVADGAMFKVKRKSHAV